MSRGGRPKERDDPERRCLVTGERGGKDGLLRFVLAPDGAVTPDLAERLPGRGVWVGARKGLVALACRKRLFSRGFKAQVAAPENLAETVDALLARRAIEALSLARKAGQAVCGFERVRDALPKAMALMQAHDGAADGKAKLRAASRDDEGEALPVSEALGRQELGLAFGRAYAIHVALIAGGAADRVWRDCARLEAYRADLDRSTPSGTTSDGERCGREVRTTPTSEAPDAGPSIGAT